MEEVNKIQRMAQIREELARLKEEQTHFTQETDRWEIIKTAMEKLEAELQSLMANA